jgi:hypothetical protein
MQWFAKATGRAPLADSTGKVVGPHISAVMGEMFPIASISNGCGGP